MAREKIELPVYTLGEELVNSISHGVGALLSIIALVLCIIKQDSTLALVSGIIYAVTSFILYLMSCLYHALKRNRAKKVFRIIDHCSIFLLIAGSYTPFTLITLGGVSGILMCAFVWICAVIGIVLNSIDLKKFKKISMVLYLVMGWTVLIAIKPLIANLDIHAIWLLLIGGIVFTIGAILYGIGSKVKHMHSVFHFFVLAGSIFQFFSIYLYVV